MIFGYARVSTSDQSLNLQIDALLQEGIERKNIHTDKISSTAKERKSLNRLWDFAREGDTIVVWKLDRLVRSLIHFTKLMNELEELSLIHISEPTRRTPISYAVFCL